MTWRFVDMHCHLDRMSNVEEVARETAARGITIFDTPVTPTDTLAAQERLGAHTNVRVGAGLHPWWLAEGRCGATDADLAAKLAGELSYIGEVGLDFGRRGGNTQELQIAAFEGICRAIAKRSLPHRVISIHAIHAATTALDILERTGVAGTGAHPGTTVIFHWFSGSSEEFARARRLDWYFSVSEHMLASKRGREYARQTPLDRLLLETDAPPGLDAPYNAAELETSLEHALEILSSLRGESRNMLRSHLTDTSTDILHLEETV